MPFYNVMLEGSGIRFAFEASDEPVIGFYTTRRVRAPDESAAAEKALALVQLDWKVGGELASANSGPEPALAVKRVTPVGLLSAILTRKPAGHTFYCHDE